MGLTKPRAAQIYNLDYKQSTRVVTVSNITLAGGAPSQVDGVNLSVNDRILVTAQSTGSQNGIYRVSVLGTGANGTWARTSDTNETGEIEAGMIVMVTEGTIYADTQWKLITNDPIVVGTTALTFTQNYSANSISSGTSNVVVNTNAAVTISSAGTANVVAVTATAVSFAGNVNPAANVTYTLGNTTNRWSDIWLSNSSIYLGNVVLAATATQLTVGGVPVVTSTSNAISASGNITGGNLLTAGVVSATGNVTGNYILGNGALLTGIASSSYGNANVAALLAAFGSNTVSTTGTVTAGNITGGNLLTAGVISATGNITGGNVSATNLTGNLTTATQANITSVGTLTSLNSGAISSSGNITGANLLTAGVISSTGNVTGNYILGNGALLTGVSTTTSNINNGTSNVTVVSSGGNVTVGIDGTGNIAEFSTTGLRVTGVTSASGNVTGGNLLTGGLISATSTITSAANITGGNISTAGLVTATGNVTGGNVLTAGVMSSTGNGIHGNVVTGGVVTATGNIQGGNLLTAGLISATSTVTSAANITGGNLLTAGLITATGNATAGNVLTAGIMSSTGNGIHGNVITGGVVTATGNVQGGNLLTGGLISATSTITSAANVTGGNITTAGLITATGNVTGGNMLTAGIMSSTGNGIHGNILTAGLISATGNVTGGNLLTAGLLSATGNITGSFVLGNGSQLTGTLTWTTQANTAPSNRAAGSFWFDSFGDKKYQLTNDGTSTVWIDQSFPTSFDTLAVTGNATVGGNLGVVGTLSYGNISTSGNVTGGNILTSGIASATGNVTGGNIRTAGLITATGNIDVGNVRTPGLISATGNIDAGNLRTAGLVTATGNVTGGNILTVGLISATGNLITGGDHSLTGNIVDTGALWINTSANGNITLNPNGTGVIIASKDILNGQANGVGNIGNATGYFNTIFARATSAQYADLAEMYVADLDYEAGTVVEFGGAFEVTATQITHTTRVAGVISTNPSYLMNATQTGMHVVPVALTGRVPCRVTGRISKGDRLVASHLTGVATVLDMHRYEPGCIIGKSLEDYDSDQVGQIEIAVGRD